MSPIPAGSGQDPYWPLMAQRLEHLTARVEQLLCKLEAQARDNELSPFWRDGDGRPLTRAQCAREGLPFEGRS